MIRVTVSDVARWSGGVVVGDPTTQVEGPVQTDSREPLDGGLFIAKRGEASDGHAYVHAAERAGAAAAIVEHPVEGVAIPQIVVDDSVHALGELARGYLVEMRSRGTLEKVIAITGSVGKTTTKLLLTSILSASAPTVAPEKSFNNEVGMPTTVMRIGEDTRFAILEMGASHRGDIQTLTRIAPPDVGCVLAVRLAHVGEFGGVENIRLAKQEMVEAVGPEGVVVLNADDPRVVSMARAARGRVVWFGTSEQADVRVGDVQPQADGISFSVRAGGISRRILLHLLGEHNAWNAAAAIACALQVGVTADRALDALEAVPHGERWRMQVMRRADGVTILNDGYNANPASMAAALRALADIGSRGHRTVAVLGGMAELGAMANAEHDKIGRLVVRLGIDQLVAVGDAARRIHLAAQEEGSWGGESVMVPDIGAAQAWLDGRLHDGDVVLVKSSNVYGLRLLGDRLHEECPA